MVKFSYISKKNLEFLYWGKGNNPCSILNSAKDLSKRSPLPKKIVTK